MSDIRDWGAFLRGRWNWTRGGYEVGFPNGCQFTDVDATIEFTSRVDATHHRLVIEPKHWDGEGERPPLPPTGQLRYLQDEASLGKIVLVLYGCGACNNPWAIYDIGRKEWFDWRGRPLAERRQALKKHIARAMGLLQKE